MPKGNAAAGADRLRGTPGGLLEPGERARGMNGHTPLLELNDLTVEFPIKGGFFGRQVAAVHAVNQVSMTVYEGETLGLVGESGSGKTTLGRAVLRLIPTTAGAIKFGGRDITALSPGGVRPLREDMQMIFQDPFGSLDPA
jgi:ABC-type microcin C transport system duplicated ATPase subunit YejF